MRCRRRGDQRGAALVEAAIATPLVLLLTFGAIEFGFAFNEQGTLRSLTRTAARSASTLPKAAYGDVVDAVLNVMSSGMDNLTSGRPEYVLIFEATGSNPTTEAECVAHSRCTVHPWVDADGEFLSASTGGTSWLPEEREACAGQTEKIGVFVRVSHPFLTGLPFSADLDDDVSLSATTVMALEPFAGPDCHDSA